MFRRLPRLPTEETFDGVLAAKTTALKGAILSTIKGTEWPSESKGAAESLLHTIESSPGIHNNMPSLLQELQGLVEQYIQVLEDVHVRLKDASSKTSIQKWIFLQHIRSRTSDLPMKCTLLLKTCQDDVSKAADSLLECLDQGRSKGDDQATRGISSEIHTQPDVLAPEQLSLPPLSLQTNLTEHATSFESSPAKTPQNPNSLSGVPEDHAAASPIPREALLLARKTFKTVEIVSGSIPVAGTYVGAVAKVGLAFVETIQTMDKNDDLANDLGTQTAKLSKLLEGFTKKPKADQGEEIADHLNDLHKALRDVHDKVNQWKSLGRFSKAFHSSDHAEALKAYQGMIQVALEEIQLLVSLDTHRVITEMKDRELQEKQRRLLRFLGDGKYGARGNAIEDVICFPGTRVEILERIDSWIGNSSDRVLWIRGMAGRGKSTIASTVLHSWRCRASCAMFHFRRGQNTLNSRIVCALARQLATSLVPEVKNAVLDSVRENEDIADQRLKEQFETLFVAPLTRLDNQAHPILIIVDALDECDNFNDAIDFVRLIDQHSAAFAANVKFLLTSRPEAPLIRAIEPRKWHSEDLDTIPDVTNDLERFIHHAFRQIRDSDPDVPKDWPSSEDVERLVEMSQGLFQWARTAIMYVSNGSPVDRLRVLLTQPSAWSGLDDLYHQIFSKAFDNVRLDLVRRDMLCRVLGTLVVAPCPVSLEIIYGLYGSHDIFHGTNREYIIPFLRRDILADLNSLLYIPLSPAEPMRLMHTSIHDLLTSNHRCEQRPYYIDLVWYHKRLANTCFKFMGEHLRENICNLSDFSKPSSEIQDVVEREVSKAVRYCCQAWSTHLVEGVQWPKPGENATTVELVDFESFSKEKVMCWLEVMGSIGALREATNMANLVHRWLLQRPRGVFELSSLATLWNDVQRFITLFSEPISLGPLHVYVSALPHCPVETELWKLYGKRSKVQTLRGVQTSTWPSNLWARYTNAGTMAVAFSPGGQVLASGLQDGKIRVWDTQTGAAISQPLTGHTRRVASVCFSPDGKVLASGSDDKTIRFWDTQTGAAIGEPLAGHTRWVTSICFSPDGKVLASGSDDKTVRFWDTQTGAAIGEPLTDHTDWVTSVCFSPDGKVLASGSIDKSIRFWDTQTRAAIGEPLTGPIRWVTSVCFSPDGKVLASGSIDETIWLWDTQTGAAIGEPLTGHTDRVTSVCFSPDGKVLASGSTDKTIRLWDIQTGAAIGEPLTGHTDRVMSVCFPPDGKVLASGSTDKTIRLWDTQTGAVIGEPPTGHTDRVTSVCFSLDGKVLASGSTDKTIRLWDTGNGATIGEPLTGHTDWVRSVCFSPDGKVLASGSDDKTIRRWDSQTGAAMGKPLTGHTRWVMSVCFSPDGKVLASGSIDETIRLWDTPTGAAMGKPLTGHTDRVTSVCFSPDGKVLASGSNDKTIRLWDSRTGAALSELLRSCDAIRSIWFSPDGALLKAHCFDGSFPSWSLITHQPCDTPRQDPSCHANPTFEHNWIILSSSRFFWLPPRFWGDHCRLVRLCGETLIVLDKETLFLFDVSQALGLWSANCTSMVDSLTHSP